jgi:O-antigen/teichoic acid export membrane protein
LTPEDFGLVAIAMLALWFVEAIVDAGTESYIIQKKSVNESELNSAWTLDLALKSIALALLLIAAPIVAWFRDSIQLLWIISATGFIVVFAMLRNPGLMLLKRQQRYGPIVKITVLAKMVSIGFAVAIAFIFKNYWALIIGQIVFEILVTSLSYRITDYRPRIDISNIREQWSFSKWLIPKSMLGYFRNHADTLVVSAFFQSAALGAYNNMKYFSSIPALQIFGPLVEPLHVEMGKVSDNLEEFKYQANLTMKVLTILVAPTVAFMFVNANELVAFFLGKQWTDYSYLFAFLSVSVLSFILISQSFRILMVSFNTKIIFLYELVSTCGIVVVLLFASGYDLHVLVLVKVLAEIIFAAALYLYTYKKVFLCSGFINLSALLLSSVACSVSLVMLRDSIDFRDLSFITLSINAFFSLLLLIFLFGVYLKFGLSDRERTLLMSMFGRFEFNIRK